MILKLENKNSIVPKALLIGFLLVKKVLIILLITKIIKELDHCV